MTAWHAGIFFSVILFGIFFDKAKSDVHKGCLLAAPMFCNFVLFSLIMNDFNTIDERSQIFAGALKKVIVTFLLGFTVAPAYYLCMGTWTMRHSTRKVMATTSSFLDVFGYGGSVLMLYLQHNGAKEEHPIKKIVGAFKYCSLTATVALLVLFIYFDESSATQSLKKKKQD